MPPVSSTVTSHLSSTHPVDRWLLTSYLVKGSNASERFGVHAPRISSSAGRRKISHAKQQTWRAGLACGVHSRGQFHLIFIAGCARTMPPRRRGTSVALSANKVHELYISSSWSKAPSSRGPCSGGRPRPCSRTKVALLSPSRLPSTADAPCFWQGLRVGRSNSSNNIIVILISAL